VRWNLRMKAAERGIWKSTEMRRRLAAAGLEISSGKMSALWIRTPTTIRLDDLDVICSVLDCSPTDLLICEPDVVVARQPAQTLPPGPDQRAQAAEAASPSPATGSEATAGQHGEQSGSRSEPVATVIADSGVWPAVLDGRANVITQIRHARLRCLDWQDAHRLRPAKVHSLAWLLGLAPVPLTHAAA
jgi:putative transcriptional regulator